MPKKQFNRRLPLLTFEQIEELAKAYDMDETQVLILAIDRMYTQYRDRAEEGRPVNDVSRHLAKDLIDEIEAGTAIKYEK